MAVVFATGIGVAPAAAPDAPGASSGGGGRGRQYVERHAVTRNDDICRSTSPEHGGGELVELVVGAERCVVEQDEPSDVGVLRQLDRVLDSRVPVVHE